MKLKKSVFLLLAGGLLPFCGCDSKGDTVTKGREAVKEVVTQPFNTLEVAKESLKQSEDKSKTSVDEIDKQLK